MPLIKIVNPYGEFHTVANAISASGTHVAGYVLSSSLGNSHRAMQWSAASGTVELEGPFGGATVAYAISSDGSIAVGTANRVDGSTLNVYPIRWVNGVAENLGLIEVSGRITLSQLNSSGTVAAGTTALLNGYKYVVRWSATDGLEALGTYGNQGTPAVYLSDDGSAIAGSQYDPSVNRDRAFRWTRAGGMVDIGRLGTGGAHVTAISADGQVVVGHSNDATGAIRAFRWTPATGMVEIDVGVAAELRTEAYSMTMDGDHVAVWVNQQDAFLWSAAGGAVPIPRLQAGWWLQYPSVAPQNPNVVFASSYDADGAGSATARTFHWTPGGGSVQTPAEEEFAHWLSINKNISNSGAQFAAGYYDGTTFSAYWWSDSLVPPASFWTGFINCEGFE